MPESQDLQHDPAVQWQATMLLSAIPHDERLVARILHTPFEQKVREIRAMLRLFTEKDRTEALALELCCMSLEPSQKSLMMDKLTVNSYEKIAKKTIKNLQPLEVEMASDQLDFHYVMSGLLRLLNFYQRFYKDLSADFKKDFRPETIMNCIEENLPMVMERLNFHLKNDAALGIERMREILERFIVSLVECLNASSMSLPPEKKDLRKTFNQRILTIFGPYFKQIESYIKKQFNPSEEKYSYIGWQEPYTKLLEIGLGCPDIEVKTYSEQRVTEGIEGEIPNFDGLRIVADGGVSNIEGVATTLRKTTRACFKKFGFTNEEADALLKAWLAGTPVIIDIEKAKDEEINKHQRRERSIFWSNFHAIQKLEKRKPGSATLLHRLFGIKNFARYNMSVLLAQAEHCDDTATPYGIVVAAEDDWNGAFTDLSITSLGLYKQIENTHRLRIVECNSKGDTLFKLARLHETYGANQKISFAIFTGHGNKDVFAIGNRGSVGEEAIFTSKDFDNPLYKEGATAVFTTDATLILDSCKTGQKDGLSQKLSRELKLKVIGANESTGMRTIEALPNGNGGLTFNVRYGEKDLSRVYDKGEPTTSNEPDPEANYEKFIAPNWNIFD